ncbi:MAG: hypothetical protein COS84_07555 [Armatimonadetes bacterium CG07_land_8_20_14_0_80_40_9]|nr:MAG: hypothetical protein COS84_07555 [Armatimonadetes bacterium CG07_land_8_20_14_0_80_40_9]
MRAFFIFKHLKKVPFSHGSTLTRDYKGRWWFACYRGSREKAKDTFIEVKVYSPSLKREIKSLYIKEPDNPMGNPVLFHYQEKVFLFYQVMYGSGERKSLPGKGWTTCKVFLRIWNGELKTIREEVIINELGYIIRSKPLIINKKIILPLHNEIFWYSLSYISEDEGKDWHFSEIIDSGEGFKKGNIEPSMVVSKNKVIAFMRSGSKRFVWQAVSKDGEVWSKPHLTNIPNPDSAVEVDKWQNNILMVSNPVHEGRTPLALLASSDEGKTFKLLKHIESKDGEYSYPAMITMKNNIYISYTYNRKKIKMINVSMNRRKGLK